MGVHSTGVQWPAPPQGPHLLICGSPSSGKYDCSLPAFPSTTRESESASYRHCSLAHERVHENDLGGSGGSLMIDEEQLTLLTNCLGMRPVAVSPEAACARWPTGDCRFFAVVCRAHRHDG